MELRTSPVQENMAVQIKTSQETPMETSNPKPEMQLALHRKYEEQQVYFELRRKI